MIVIDIHRTEFQECENLTKLSYPLLPEKNRTFRGHLTATAIARNNGRQNSVSTALPTMINDPLHNQQRLSAIVVACQIWIERGIAWPTRRVVFPVIGKEVEG